VYCWCVGLHDPFDSQIKTLGRELLSGERRDIVSIDCGSTLCYRCNMVWKYVNVEGFPEDNYAVLTVAREPVNSLNLQVWSELLAALQYLEANSNVKVLVIASGLKKDVYCAGNDITELYAPMTTAARYRQFWEVSNRCARVWLTTVGTLKNFEA
jgi:hypothetical protein